MRISRLLSILFLAITFTVNAQPPRVILDTDMGSSTDDIFALQLLNRYMDEGRCQLIGVVCDRKGDSCAAMIDLLNTFYGHGDIPIGLERNYDRTPQVFTKYCAMRGDSSILNNANYEFKRNNKDISLIPDGWRLYRQLLADSPDSSVSIVSIGFMTSLSHLLNSGPDSISSLSGKELFGRKVRDIFVMGGRFYENCQWKPVGVGYNIEMRDDTNGMDLSYADTVLTLMPETVKIIFSPTDVGKTVKYEIDSVLADIENRNHPVRLVYSNFTTSPEQYMWDAMPVINCVEGDSLFHMSKPGIVRMDMNHGKLIFIPSPFGNVRYQYVARNDKEKLYKAVMTRIRASY